MAKFLRYLKTRPLAMASFVVLALLYLVMIFAEFVAPYPATRTFERNSYHPANLQLTKSGLVAREHRVINQSTWEYARVSDEGYSHPVRLFVRGSPYRLLGLIPTDIHLFGTVPAADGTTYPVYLLGADILGRDLFSRIVHGSRISLTIGFVAAAISLFLAVLLGGLSGYFGGAADWTIMRFAEFFMLIPSLYFILFLRSLLNTRMDSGTSYMIITTILALVSWPGTARTIRGMVHAVKREEFIVDADLEGIPALVVIFGQIIPQMASLLIVSVALSVPGFIMSETTLSYLGLGISDPAVSWGSLINRDIATLTNLVNFPWLLCPVLMLLVVTLAFNFIADALRDFYDPYNIVFNRRKLARFFRSRPGDAPDGSPDSAAKPDSKAKPTAESASAVAPTSAAKPDSEANPTAAADSAVAAESADSAKPDSKANPTAKPDSEANPTASDSDAKPTAAEAKPDSAAAKPEAEAKPEAKPESAADPDSAEAEAKPESAKPGARPLLAVRDLHVTFSLMRGTERIPVHGARGVSFTLDRGEILGIVGESGSGKSVSTTAIPGLLPANAHAAGSIFFDGTDLMKLSPQQLREYRGKRIGLVFQEPGRSFDPLQSVGKVFWETFRNSNPAISREESDKKAAALLQEVELPDPAGRLASYPHQFSGGQLQRIGIALALAQDCDLLIADEPTTALDVTIEAQIVSLLLRLKAERGLAVIFISHDIHLVGRISDRIAVMYGGKIMETGTARQVMEDPRHPYTQALLSATPEFGSHYTASRMAAIPGQVCDPTNPPPGCPFQPRCPFAREHCTKSAACWRMGGEE